MPETSQQQIRDTLSFLEDHLLSDALRNIEIGIKKFPDQSVFWFYLTALVSLKQSFPGKAYTLLQQAHRLQPDILEIINAMLTCASLLGKLEDTLYYAKLGLAAKTSSIDGLYPSWLPNPQNGFFGIHQNLHGKSIKKMLEFGNIEKAILLSEDILGVSPNSPTALTRHAEMLYLGGRPFEAVFFLKQLLEQNALSAENQTLIIKIFNDIGQYHTAYALCQEFIDNTTQSAQKNHLYRLYSEILREDPEKTQKQKNAKEEQLAKKITLSPLHDYRKKEKTKEDGILRIGILCSSFLKLSFNARLAMFFASFKKSNCEVFFYFDGVKKDQTAQWLQQFTRHFRFVDKIDDETLAYIIHEDEIDILITMDNEKYAMERQEIILRRPATLHLLAFGFPETAHFWGYDAVLGDPWIYPTKIKNDRELVYDKTNPCPIIRIRKGFLDVWNMLPHEEKTLLESPLLRIGLGGSFDLLRSQDFTFLSECLKSNKMALIVHLDLLGGKYAFEALCDSLDCPEDFVKKRVFAFSSYDDRLDFFQEIDVLAPPCTPFIIASGLKNGIIPFILDDEISPQRRLAHSFLVQNDVYALCHRKNYDSLKETFEDLSEDRQKITYLRKALSKALISIEEKTQTQADKCVLFFDDLQFCLTQKLSQEPV